VRAASVVAFGLVFFLIAATSAAQDLFEIQVYPYETVEPGRTMVEFHENYTLTGSTVPEEGLYPTSHQFHLTLEITHGSRPASTSKRHRTCLALERSSPDGTSGRGFACPSGRAFRSR
jgi:hypothetical protein